MDKGLKLQPQVVPPLGGRLAPAALAKKALKKAVEESGVGAPLVIALERPDGAISRYETALFPNDHPYCLANQFYAERMFKFLLWQRGGYRAYVGGPEEIGRNIQELYSSGEARAFDVHLMEEIYGERFQVIACSPQEVPSARECFQPLGGHFEGHRIGFDLGASDIKVAALIDGEPVFSDEIIWEPTREPDPAYHYQHILACLLYTSPSPRD